MYTGQCNFFTIYFITNWLIYMKSHSLIKGFLNIVTINDSGHKNMKVIFIKYKRLFLLSIKGYSY